MIRFSQAAIDAATCEPDKLGDTMRAEMCAGTLERIADHIRTAGRVGFPGDYMTTEVNCASDGTRESLTYTVRVTLPASSNSGT